MSWPIFQRWFNVAPQANAKYFTDNQGEKIWISWSDRSEEMSRLYSRHRGYPAGMVTFIKEDKDLLTLADIHVTQNYRHRGIGKGLMQEALKWARKNNFRKIKGLMMGHDGISEEYIREWYKRQGFHVTGRQISLEL